MVMRIFASITLSIFYCLFVSSSENVHAPVPEIDSDQSTPTFARENSVKEIHSHVKKGVCHQGCVKHITNTNESPIICFLAFLFVVLFFWDILLLHPRTLRIKSGLSPPVYS